MNRRNFLKTIGLGVTSFSLPIGGKTLVTGGAIPWAAAAHGAELASVTNEMLHEYLEGLFTPEAVSTSKVYHRGLRGEG